MWCVEEKEGLEIRDLREIRGPDDMLASLLAYWEIVSYPKATESVDLLQKSGMAEELFRWWIESSWYHG